MTRTYSDAVKALNTLQSNFSVVDAIRKSGRGMNQQAIPEMVEWCCRVGYEPSDFDKLNIIHIAGTKGKGSTSAFISSILARYLPVSGANGPPSSLSKIGLYTSPHLRFVRERIRINGEPISEAAFASYFFEIWDRLEAAAKASTLSEDNPTKPVYFRFLTLMAFHTYLREGVDTAVIECGIGGEYDSTNILMKPTVVGITSLGIDHTAMLGDSIQEIAWHKAGIIKSGSVAFTAAQPEVALEVLRARAKEKGVELQVVGLHPQVEDGSVKLGLEAAFQKMNASLAIEVAAAHLRVLGREIVTRPLPTEFVQGLEGVKWGGRCETRREEGLRWCLDGGHTLESIRVAGEWFASSVIKAETATDSEGAPKEAPPRILLFNQQTRAGFPLLASLHSLLASALETNHPFSHVVFCSNVTFVTSGYRPDLMSMNTSTEEVDALKVQKEFAVLWREINGEGSDIGIVRTIEEAVGKCREIARVWRGREGTEEWETMVLVTGSIHLVGGVLEVLETEAEQKAA